MDEFLKKAIRSGSKYKWKKNILEKIGILGKHLHSGIGQGYFQSTPIQLCLMTAQIANGGFEIKPRIIFDKEKNNLKRIFKI